MDNIIVSHVHLRLLSQTSEFFEVEMRKAYLFIAAVFLLSSSLTFVDWFNMVSENASRTAPLDHFTQYDDSSSRTGVSL